MIRYFFIFFLAFSNTFSRDFYEGDSLIKEGVHAFYNYEYDRAINVLNIARKTFPDHPGVHMIWAASRWVRAQSIYSTDRSNQVLEEDLASIKPVYKILTKKYEYDPNYFLYQGSTIGLSARVTLGKKQWLRTLYRAYTGFSIINDIFKEHSQIYDAYLPIGIIEYYCGISKSILKWPVKAYGMNPSTESGLDKIEISAEKGNWSWIEAKGILSYLYLWVEENPIMAYRHSKDLVKYFPNNFYFNILYLESSIRTGNKFEIPIIFDRLNVMFDELTPRQREWYLPYLNYEKALNLFYENQYKEVINLLDLTINNYSAELDIILGNALLLKGMTYDMMNKRIQAKSNYIKCKDLDNFSSSMKKARKYLDQPYQGR